MTSSSHQLTAELEDARALRDYAASIGAHITEWYAVRYVNNLQERLKLRLARECQDVPVEQRIAPAPTVR